MRRVRHILNFCLAGFIASACTKTGIESNTELPIQFSGSANEVTVTEVNDSKTFDDDGETFIANNIADLKDRKITLYGTEYANGATNKVWNFIDGWEATVKESGSNFVFDYATGNQMKYYKPQDGLKYDFRAVFPEVSADTASAVSLSTQGFPYLRIKLIHRPDLMVAKADEAIKPVDFPVSIPLKFEHQLALITFNIYKDIETLPAPGTESHSIYLNKMTLAGRTIADFNVVTQEFSSIDGKTGATVRVPGYPYSDFLIKETPEKIRDLFLFVADGDIEAESYTFDFIINEKSYKAVLPASGKRWEKGQNYIYNIKVVGSDVYIELGHSDDESMKLTQEKWDDEDMEGEVGIIEGR